MIGKLKGVLDSVGDGSIILDVGGVGYEIHCSTRTLANLPSIGETLSISIETHIRETEIKLFGFSTEPERNWFRLLQSVQGVGAKVALAIQATLSTDELASAIALQDKAIVSRAPGVGPKVAQRIVTELKDKIPAYSATEAEEIGLAQEIGEGLASSAVQDAMSALVNLGYSSQQATSAISAGLKKAEGDVDSETLIRFGLKELAA